jgi:hypothetical protein
MITYMFNIGSSSGTCRVCCVLPLSSVRWSILKKKGDRYVVLIGGRHPRRDVQTHGHFIDLPLRADASSDCTRSITSSPTMASLKRFKKARFCVWHWNIGNRIGLDGNHASPTLQIASHNWSRLDPVLACITVASPTKTS